MSLTTILDLCLSEESLRGGRWWRMKCPVGLAGCVRTGGMAAVWLLMTLAVRGESADTAKEPPKDRVVAKVNGMPIYGSDLDAMISAQVRMLRVQLANDPARLKKELSEVKNNALNGLIDFQLMEDEFFRLGGMIQQEDIDEDVKLATQESFKGDRAALIAELNAIGMTYDKFRELRERMVIASAVRARIANNVEVTDAMVKEHYEKNLKRWHASELVKFHTLTIFNKTANDHTLAESLHTRLLSGGDFAEVARENSKDSRADDGGAWPWTHLSDINDKVGKVMEKMKKGEISEVLEQQGTYLILRVDDIQEADPKSFESVKEEVKKSLMEELARVRIENRLCRLREAADIQKMGPV
ncbi:MAG: hypothetical protein B7Z37_13165 [Verrucomicrobia bacterium 12-59-8]|nr:MAG: hypothetical protein B7Z37_13165 [Verrucomicrobia bacterium 12-59-8]